MSEKHDLTGISWEYAQLLEWHIVIKEDGAKGARDMARTKRSKVDLKDTQRMFIKQERNRITHRGDYFRQQLMQRYGERCASCGAKENLRLDHIRPVSKGGRSELSNLQLLCPVCDEKKRDRIINFRSKK